MNDSFFIKPHEQIQQKKRLMLQIPLADMKRLEILDNTDKLKAVFDLAQSEHGITIRIQIETCVQIRCQRCLSAMSHAISIDNQLLIINPDFDDSLYEGDCVLLENGIISLLGMVEDEILISLPNYAMHDSEKCHAVLPKLAKSKVIKTHKPFANLKELRDKINI